MGMPIRASTILKLETKRRLNELKETAFHFARTRGLSQDSLRYVLEGRVPSVDRAQRICQALGLEFYLGPPRGEGTSTEVPLGADISSPLADTGQINAVYLAQSMAKLLVTEPKITQKFADAVIMIYDQLRQDPTHLDQLDMIEDHILDHLSSHKALDYHLFHACLMSLWQWMKENHTTILPEAQAEILVNLYALASHDDCLSHHSTEEQVFFDILLRMIHK